ncbi:caffeic acid [Musa troglodytarum]|uniref:Caffeic acid n=1 Tax=Musa troglodytarum TaxID=320322 RepID=A0A9E7JP41_9LILI|nr:caffeic acid [Musa troglodytarum]
MFFFDYQGADPRFNKVFNEAMRGHTAVLVNQLLRTYGGFDDVKVLVDVGGGVGATLGMITSRHPHIKGINLDLPHVISSAQPLPGVQHVSGDMFEAVPSGDAIFLEVRTDSSDHYKNSNLALPEKRKVIVIECVLPVVPEVTLRDQYIYQLDICMLTYTIGGKENGAGVPGAGSGCRVFWI